MVNITFDEPSKDFPSPDLELDVQRGERPDAPGGVLLFDIKLFLYFYYEPHRFQKPVRFEFIPCTQSLLLMHWRFAENPTLYIAKQLVRPK